MNAKRRAATTPSDDPSGELQPSPAHSASRMPTDAIAFLGQPNVALVLFTFVAKDMRLLCTIAIFSNLGFITCGTIEWLPPVFFLHRVLLPLNLVRLAEIVRASRATGDLTQSELARSAVLP